jgi:hypothetical protein
MSLFDAEITRALTEHERPDCVALGRPEAGPRFSISKHEMSLRAQCQGQGAA